MSKYLIEEETLQNLADATRAVSETEENMSTEEMVATLLATAQILPNVVRMTAQTLTDEQKQKARENIGAASSEYIDSEITDLKAVGVQQVPMFANDTSECTDTTKVYVLPDGYIYAYMLTEITSGGGYTNVLENASISLNSRYNSSNTLKSGAAGYIAVTDVVVSPGDVIRFKPSTLAQGVSGGYQRLRLLNSSGTVISQGDTELATEYPLTVTDGVGMLTLPTTDSGACYYSQAVKMRMNLYVSSASVTEADLEGLVVTVNEEIKEAEPSIGYGWANTGRAFVPANYEDRIVELEEVLKLQDVIQQQENEIEKLKTSENNLLDGMEVFAPSPQLPADGSATSDFNAETITCQQVYDYIDALTSRYPKYITKETMGKDESGEFDWNRYTLCRRYYEAWQRQNYPKMYGWTNGSTTIYSVSVSPRIGDTLYSTPYIGTTYSTVTVVDNANQSRTVNGLVFTRDSSKDVDPTLVYSNMLSCTVGKSVYDSSKAAVTTIASISCTTLVGANGVTYARYPLGDRNSAFAKPKVIVIGSNEHGRPTDPAEPTIISARMIKDLCECVNANNPFFNMLKNDYMMIFCPIINPWGFDETHKSYYNSNGVNLDRNLDTPGWGNDSSYPQGEYGGSECEMQYFMNTLVESETKIVMTNHALGTHTNDNGEGANDGKCHYMFGRNNRKYDDSLLSIAETMLANYNLSFSDYGEAPPESYAKTRSYIDWIGAEGGAVEMQAREGYVSDGTSQLHTSRILEADYTLHLQFLYMLINHQG